MAYEHKLENWKNISSEPLDSQITIKKLKEMIEAAEKQGATHISAKQCIGGCGSFAEMDWEFEELILESEEDYEIRVGKEKIKEEKKIEKVRLDNLTKKITRDKNLLAKLMEKYPSEVNLINKIMGWVMKEQSLRYLRNWLFEIAVKNGYCTIYSSYLIIEEALQKVVDEEFKNNL